MNLTANLTEIDPKLEAIMLREGRRKHTFNGRHEWRRYERPAWVDRRHREQTGESQHFPKQPKRPRETPRHEIEAGFYDFLDGPVGNGSSYDTWIADERGTYARIYELVRREVPQIFDRYRASTVFQLVRRFGIGALVQGYRTSQETRLPLEAEVRASYNESQMSKTNGAPDPEIMEIFAQEQDRGLPPSTQLLRQLYSPIPKYRNRPGASRHYHEHLAEQALEGRLTLSM